MITSKFNDYFQDVDVLSFGVENESDSNYTLKKTDNELKKKLKKFVRNLNKAKKTHTLLYRGDSIPNEIYNLFKEKNLGRFFIVGEKSKSNVIHLKNEFDHCRRNNNENIRRDIKKLIEICNNEIINRSERKPDDINGSINSSVIGKIPDEKLEFFKLMLLSFLHNKGNDKYYKNYSPFLSLSSSFDTAVNFATQKKHDKQSVSIVFFYILNNKDKFYTAKRLKDNLNEYDVSWYEDIHNEYLVLGGMYPDYLIGFYELDENGNPKSFILNPWFKKALENNITVKNYYVYIDQSRLLEYARDLQYNSIVKKIRDNEQFIIQIDMYQNEVMLGKPMQISEF